MAERGYELKSASSTIDNITAESLIEEFKSDGHGSSDSEDTVSEASGSEKSTSEHQTDPKPSKIPLVKSKDDIEREKREQEAAELAERESQNQETKPNQEEKEEKEAEAPKQTMAPPPPSSKAALPPPPPSKAGKPQVPAPPSPIGSDEIDPAEQDGVVEGNLVIVKPPIVVRDFAVLLGLKPFQLISELMEMGIFASMNQTIEEDVARKISR